MRFNIFTGAGIAPFKNSRKLAQLPLLFVFLLLVLLASQSASAQSFSITCSNLNNNPSSSDCLIDYGSGTPVAIQDSQLANLVNDFDEIKTCSDAIAAGNVGQCSSARFQCDIAKDGGGSVTDAACVPVALKNELNPVFTINCSTISASDAVCTVTNNVSAVRDILFGPGSTIGKTLTPTQLTFADTLLTVCNNQYGITTALQSDCLLLETLLSNGDPQASRFIKAITPDAASAAVDATQTSLRGINRNIAQRMSSIRRAARLARMAANQGGKGPGDGDGSSGDGDKKDEDKDQQKDGDQQGSQLNLPFAAGNAVASSTLGAEQWRYNYRALTGGGASADATNGQLGVFVNAMGDKGDRDSTDKERGFTFNGNELTAGVDYRVGESGFLGMAFGFTHSSTDVKDGRGNLANRAYNLVLYGSVNPDQQSFIDVNMIVGGGQFEQDRIAKAVDLLNPANTIDQVYSASYFSHQSSLNLSMGYDLSSGSFSFSPYVGLTVMNSKADAYSESASNPNAVGAGYTLAIDEQSFASKTMTVGTQFSYASNHAWGVLMPQATLEWINETKGHAEVVKGHFTGDPSQQKFRLPSDDVDSVYYSLGLGCSAIYPGGNTLYGYYQTFMGYEGFRYSSINLGMRWEL